MNCGYGEKLILYFYGEAAEGLKAGVENHLAGCAACRGELAALKAAEERLSAFAAEPSSASVAAVMRAARAAVSRRRGFSFNWGEALLSGALASVLAVVFAFSGRGASADLAWNSKLDSGLDSVEYSIYQAQSDMASVSSDWEYKYSALEDEGLQLGGKA
jgi:anti-sigma factor RsiW